MENTPAKVTVNVAPAVLVWARESIGLSREEAARKLGTKEHILERLERGEGTISMPRLRRMTEVYQRPMLAFFLPRPPREDDTLPDFRLLPENRGRSWSTELHKAYRRVVGQREVALDLVDPEEEPLPSIDLRLSVGDDDEESAEQIRSWLQMPARFPTNEPYAIFNGWARLIEAQGVLVTQVSGVPIEEMRGFSIGEHPLPIIALNGSDAIRGRLFTLLHELTHILLHTTALCDLEDDPKGRDADRSVAPVETYCNAVAAATLIPLRGLRQEPLFVHNPDRREWTDDELSYLAGRFGVSEEAMLVRLMHLGRASYDFYLRMRPLFLARYRQRQRRQRSDDDAGGGNYYPETIRNLGRRYLNTVWGAYQRGVIDEHDVSTYLQVRLNNLPTLFQRLGVRE